MNLKAGLPLWLIKSGLPYDYSRLSQSVKTDVAIIGGGISGALTGYYLTNAGMDCIILDGRTIGLGSTCASTSLLQYEIDTPLSKLTKLIGYKNAVRSYQLCRDAIYKLQDIAVKIGFDDFELRNSLYYAASKKDVTGLNEEFIARRENGFGVEWLSTKEVFNDYGFSPPGAILSTDGAVMNSYLFTHALHQHGMKKGLKVYDRSPVISFDHKKEKVLLKTDLGFSVEAKKVVYAVGYEVINYIRKKIVTLNCTYAIASEQQEHSQPFWRGNVMIWNTAHPYLYIRTTRDGRIIIGGGDEPFLNQRKTDRLLTKKSKQLVKDFEKLFPHIPFKTEFNWSGIFGSTKDGLPFIGPYKKIPNSYFALGFGGNGITFSLIAAEIIADLLHGKKNEDAAIFSFDRA